MIELAKEEWAVLPYASKKINKKVLITTRFGQWAILDEHEFVELDRLSLKEDSSSFDRLKKADIIISKDNAGKIVQDFRNLNSNLFNGPSLHIISLTSRCNFGCSYCHSSSPIKTSNNVNVDLDKKGALKFLTLIFDSNSHNLSVEFQGGEPLLNWEVLSFIVTTLKKMNLIEKRDLKISIVSNFSLLDEEKLSFLLENGVNICTSLDGLKEVHNANRPFLNTELGTYDKVVEWILKIKKKAEELGKKELVQALITITKSSLNYPHEIVDEYVRLGFTNIHLRMLSYLGVAKLRWEEIGYSAEEYIVFWRKAMDHIIELNKKGVYIKERMAVVMLTKIIKKEDPMYTELMSPCGAGRSQILYNEDGSIYTCDEGRMLGNDLFKIGDLYSNSFSEVMGDKKILEIAKASLIDFYEPDSVYAQWIGTCPVENISSQGNLVLKTKMSMRYKIYVAQFDYLFEKMIEDPEAIEIFKKWVNIKEIDGKKVS